MPARWRIPSPFDTDAGRGVGWPLAGGPPTAIFAVNDFLAVGVMGAARERGLEAGRDVAIVGYNDTPLAGAAHRPEHHPFADAQMGRLGLELLLQKLAGGDPGSLRLAPSLVVRGSTTGPCERRARAQTGLTARVARKVGR